MVEEVVVGVGFDKFVVNVELVEECLLWKGVVVVVVFFDVEVDEIVGEYWVGVVVVIDCVWWLL